MNNIPWKWHEAKMGHDVALLRSSKADGVRMY